MSKLAYRAGLEIPALNFYSLAFSPCGTKLAAGMANGDIFVWDALTGSQYYPTLTSPCIGSPDISGPSVVIWLDETVFLCGFSDGYVTTCCLQELSEPELGASSTYNSPHSRYRLHILRRHVTNEPIKFMSYNQKLSCVAVSGTLKTRLWIKKGTLDWELWTSLKEPSSLEERNLFPVVITSSSWLPNSSDGANQLIVSYLHNGIIIWDVHQAEPIRSINAGGVIFGGVWCTEAHKFVAINGVKKVDVYDLETGRIWSPKYPNNVATVQSIHCGTGFVAGNYMGQAELVDIMECLILQTLQNDVSSAMPVASASEITAEHGGDGVKVLAVHQDITNENFMIAMAFRGKCILWRT